MAFADDRWQEAVITPEEEHLLKDTDRALQGHRDRLSNTAVPRCWSRGFVSAVARKDDPNRRIGTFRITGAKTTWIGRGHPKPCFALGRTSRTKARKRTREPVTSPDPASSSPKTEGVKPGDLPTPSSAQKPQGSCRRGFPSTLLCGQSPALPCPQAPATSPEWRTLPLRMAPNDQPEPRPSNIRPPFGPRYS